MSAIFRLQAKDSVVRLGAFDCLNGITSLSWDSAMNAENLEELGNPNYAAQTIEPTVSGSFEARATGSLASILGRMIQTFDPATGEFTGYLGPSNGHLIREIDLQYTTFDLIEAQKANEVFDRATLIPRAVLSSFSVSASADGVATESFNFDADFLEIYRAPLHDLIALPVMRNVGGNPEIEALVPPTYKVEGVTTVADAEWKIHALDIDGVRVPVADLEVTPDENGDVVALSSAAQSRGIRLVKGAKLTLIIYRKTPGQFPVIVNPTEARFVRADSISIWLLDPRVTVNVGGQVRTIEEHINAGVDLNEIPFSEAERMLRVQSIDLNVDLQREELREIAKNDRGTSVFARTARYPLNITCSISSLVTDLKDWQKIQRKDDSDVLDLKSFENQEWIIATRMYMGDTVLQTIALLDARVDSAGQNVAVGGSSERSWSFTGSKIAIKGNPDA